MQRAIHASVIVLSVLCVCTFALPRCSAEAPGTQRVPERRPEPGPRPIRGGNYYYDLARVHKMYGVYDKAIEMLEMAIENETDPMNKTRYYESLGEVYRLKGEPKEAAVQVKKALAGAQGAEEKCQYSSLLGRIYEETGDFQSAKEAYQYVVANSKVEAQKRSAQHNLFRLYQKSGELEKVIADLEKKLEKTPDDEQTLDMLAQIFSSVVRDSSRELPVYEKLAKLKPGDAAILNRLVYLYQGKKEYEKAADVYKKIVEISPPQSKSYNYQHVSQMYMLAGNKDEAIKWAEKAISEGPARPYTYVSVVRLYLQNGLSEKALQLYDKAIAACERPMEKHQLSLQFADLFAQNNMENKAEELYKEVLKEATVASFKAQARSKLIALYRKQGKTSEIEALTAEEGSPTPAPK